MDIYLINGGNNDLRLISNSIQIIYSFCISLLAIYISIPFSLSSEIFSLLNFKSLNCCSVNTFLALPFSTAFIRSVPDNYCKSIIVFCPYIIPSALFTSITDAINSFTSCEDLPASSNSPISNNPLLNSIPCP